MQNENTAAPALPFDTDSRNKLVRDFNRTRKKDALVLATVTAAAAVIAGYGFFYFAGFSLLTVAGYEIGVALVGAVIWFAFYLRWLGYLINEWTQPLMMPADSALPASWLKDFDEQFPIRKELIENSSVHYLFANERTFILIHAEDNGDEIAYRVESDVFMKEKLQSLVS
jgi:hypothetical protein